MDSHIAFLITTYNREESLKSLIREIASLGDIYIMDDGTEPPVNIDSSYLKGNKIFLASKEHGGKKKYWETVNALWLMIYNKSYKYYFMVPDDFLPVNNFLTETLHVWEKIQDPRKICINTYVSQGRIGKKNWTGFMPVEHKYYRKTQWVDMCFMCERRFFDTVGWLPRINLDWRHKPNLSSGVGSYISMKLHREGFSLLQTKTSMFVPQQSAYQSQMNGWRDENDPLNIPVL